MKCWNHKPHEEEATSVDDEVEKYDLSCAKEGRCTCFCLNRESMECWYYQDGQKLSLGSIFEFLSFWGFGKVGKEKKIVSAKSCWKIFFGLKFLREVGFEAKNCFPEKK